MSKKYLPDIKVIKKPLTTLKKWCVILLVIVVVCGVYILADYCSGALTMSNIVVSLSGGDKVSRDKHSLYAVVMGTYDTYSEAERVGLGLQVQGAGGFVWQVSNKYLVVGSIYKDKDAADKVIENLKDSKYTTSVYEIKYPKISMHIKGMGGEDRDMIVSILDYIDRVYSEVYTYSLEYDSANITNLQISSYINTMLSESKVYVSALQEMSTRVGDKYIGILRDTMIAIETGLDAGMYRTLTDSGVNYYLKYLLCDIVHMSYEMYMDISRV